MVWQIQRAPNHKKYLVYFGTGVWVFTEGAIITRFIFIVCGSLRKIKTFTSRHCRKSLASLAFLDGAQCGHRGNHKLHCAYMRNPVSFQLMGVII